MSKYYIYAHYDNTGCLVYIGKGKNERAWSVRDRNKHHFELMEQQLPLLNVKILMHNILNEREALSLEKEMILQFKPEYNIAHTERNGVRSQERWSKMSEEDRQLFLEAGRSAAHIANRKKVNTPEGVFDSVSIAAKALGIVYKTAVARAYRETNGWSYLNG